jgi:hypothetical protein
MSDADKRMHDRKSSSETSWDETEDIRAHRHHFGSMRSDADSVCRWSLI